MSGTRTKTRAKTVDFYKRTALVCSRIPSGKVATYGQIALLCGYPKNARQVGYALGHGLAGVEAPAHRVVNSKGILSGAASFATPEIQRQMLEKEDVFAMWTGEVWKVELKKYGWKNTMEDALELRADFTRMEI